MANSEAYFGTKAGIVWQALSEHGSLSSAQLKKQTKLSDRELYGALGWLAREGKLDIAGDIPLLFKFSLRK